MFIGLLSVCKLVRFSGSLPYNYKSPIKYISLNNHQCQARPALVNINSDETLFYPVTVSVNKFGGSCNTIYDPYARVCVLNKVKYNTTESSLDDKKVIRARNNYLPHSVSLIIICFLLDAISASC